MKKCPYCAEEIQDEAIKCKHCGELLDKAIKPLGRQAAIDVEEKILREDKPAFISYLGIFIIGILLLLLAFIGVFVILWAILHRNSTTYTITSRRVRTKSGILGRKIDEIDIAHIRSVSLRQSFDAKLLGYGDVLIGTAGTSGYEIILKGIENPQDVVTLIKDLQKN